LLRLAFGGLWWRRAISVILLLVASVTTAAAAAAPSYADSARDAVLQVALRRAPVGSLGTGVEVTAGQSGKPSVAGLQAVVRSAFSGAVKEAYPRPIIQLSVTQRVAAHGSGGLEQIALLARDGVCGALRVLAGACVNATDPFGVVVDARLAAEHRLRVGSTLHAVPLRGGLTTTALHVRGIATRASATDPYWFGVSMAGPADVLPVWAPASYFSALRVESGDGVVAAADLVLDRSAVHVRSIGPLEDKIDAAVRRLETDPSRPTVTTRVQQVVDRGLRAGSRLGVPIAVAIAELLALGWYLLHALIGGSVEGRGAEVALGKVRGLSPRQTLLLVLLEPALLLAVAVPLGVLVAAVLEGWLVPIVLGRTTDVEIGWASWLAAGAAAAGGLLAAAAASRAVFRRPVLEQWRGSARAPYRSGVVVEVVVVVLAVVGIVQLELSGASGSGSGNGLAVLAPMLLIVAGALVASRLVVELARLGFRATRASGAVAAFVGLRQLVRRPAGRRTFGVLVVATALAVYGVSSAAVLAQNRDQRALTDVGAATVVHIVPDPATDQRIAKARATLVVTPVSQAPIQLAAASGVFGGASASGSPSVLVVDPATFGSVAYWRHDFGSAALPVLMKGLEAPAPVSPTITGTSIELDITAATVPPSFSLSVDLTDRRGAAITASLGTLAEGSRTYTAAIRGCAAGCALRRIYVNRPADQLAPFVAGFTVQDIRGRLDEHAFALQPAVTGVAWSPLNPTPDAQLSPAEAVRTGASGLTITIAASGLPSGSVPGFGAVAGAANRVPALLAADLTSGDAQVTAQTTAGTTFALDAAHRPTVIPRLGDAGVVIPRDWLAAASPSGDPELLADQLWIAADAPASTISRLRSAGITVTSIERADTLSTEFASEGPAFATALSIAMGFTAALLGIAAVVLGLGLLARRRVFELSAMRALGVRTASLIGSVLVEQAVVILAAAVCGLLLALLSVQMTLPALPAYADDPQYPAFVVDQPLGLLLLVTAAVAALQLVAVTATAVALTRSVSVTRLREAEQ